MSDSSHGLAPKMLVLRLQHTFPMRVTEWVAAAILVSLSVSFLSQPTMFSINPFFEEMRHMAPQTTWGGACFVLGVARIVVLFINGAWKSSPHLRAAMAFLSCFIWLQLVFAVWHISQPSLGAAIFPWFLVLDTYSVFRASSDARLSDELSKRSTLAAV